MQRLFSARPLLAVAIAFGGLAAASGAQAGGLSDAIVSVTVQAPVRHVQPAPVVVQPAPVSTRPAPAYARPAPVYVQPAPVYVQPAPVYAQPAPVYVQPRVAHGPSRGYESHAPWGDVDRDGVPNRYDRHDDRRVAYRSGWGDADRDGVPNRYDRAPHNPYRR